MPVRFARPRQRSQTFTGNGTWVCPAGVFVVALTGWGAGGGGAAGRSGSTRGGGGGGAALAATVMVAVVPGTSYSVTIGTGGAGGTANNGGGAGGDTTFGTLACFRGASGGANSSASTSYNYGGIAINCTPTAVLSISSSIYNDTYNPDTGGSYSSGYSLYFGPGIGGVGSGNNAGTVLQALSGSRNNVGLGTFEGGTPGAISTNGGGGGGAAGPGGVGSAGAAGSSGTPSAAANAANNSGAGGGGGGAGGSSGAGGNGGSGQLIVSWVQ